MRSSCTTTSMHDLHIHPQTPTASISADRDTRRFERLTKNRSTRPKIPNDLKSIAHQA